MKKRAFALFLCCALVVSLLTSCGGNSDTQAQGGEKNPEEITISTEVKMPLDPFTYATDTTRNIVDPLIRFDRLAEGDDAIVPQLAESYKMSEDGRDWTFHLRDAKFSNGKQVTADDVVYSFNYMLGTPTGAVNYVGYSIEATDEKTVVFHVENYSPTIPFYVSLLPIIDSESFESVGADEYFKTMVGTGPYVLESYDEATGLTVLTANENYWGEQPSIKKVTIRYVPDPNTALIALRKGEVDFTDIPSSTYKQANDDENLKVAFGLPTLGNFIVFNTEMKPFDNQKVRQAILYALDCDGLASMSAVEGDYVVENCFYQDDWGIEKPANFTIYNYDPEKAKSLLKEAGVSLPLDLGEVKIMESQKATWEAIQQQLAEIDVNIKVSSVESTVWLDSLWKGDFAMAAITDTDLGGTGGYAGICDIFHSEGIELGYNYSRYNDPDFDKIIDVARRSSDKAEADQAFADVLNTINDQALWGSLFHYGRIYVMNKSLNAQTDDPEIYFADMSWS